MRLQQEVLPASGGLIAILEDKGSLGRNAASNATQASDKPPSRWDTADAHYFVHVNRKFLRLCPLKSFRARSVETKHVRIRQEHIVSAVIFTAHLNGGGVVLSEMFRTLIICRLFGPSAKSSKLPCKSKVVGSRQGSSSASTPHTVSVQAPRVNPPIHKDVC